MNKPINWYGVYIWLGKAAYIVAAPLRWIFLSHTHRGYAWIEHDARVLLVRNWFSRGEWSLPGGGIHGWERAVDGVKRELHEEIGMDEVELAFLGEGFKRERIGGKHYMLYRVICDEQPTLHCRRREITAFEWVPLPNIAARADISEEVRVAFGRLQDNDAV